MSDVTTIRLKNQFAALERLSQGVEEFGSRHNLTPKLIFAVTLALDEIVTNVISYAYDDGKEHDILVRLLRGTDDLTVEVEDAGRPFNPLTARVPDLNTQLADREVGGLGIHLVRKLMDDLEYRREQGKNILVMRRKVARSE